MRKWRQFLCTERCSNYQDIMRDMRLSTCRNRANSSLVTILKTELECGYYGVSSSSFPIILSDSYLFQLTFITALVGMSLIRQLTTY